MPEKDKPVMGRKDQVEEEIGALGLRVFTGVLGAGQSPQNAEELQEAWGKWEVSGRKVTRFREERA